MYTNEIIPFVATLCLSFLRSSLQGKVLHPLQIIPSDSWRVQFLAYDVIPDALSEAPKYQLQVNFTQGRAVEFGTVLHPDETNSEPVFINTTTDFGFHVLIMTDLDYPSPTSHLRREYLHWMVCNINHVHLSDGDIFSAYVPPHRSGHRGGVHRYMLAYFHQPEGPVLDFLDFAIPKEETKHPERMKFSTKTFSEQYNLSLPVAANFFRIEWPNDSDRIN